MAINPGRLRHLVSIMAPGTPTRDEGGGFVPGAASEFAEVWAAIEPLDGFERLQAMQTQAAVTHRILMRYRAGITASMWIVHEGRRFDLVGPPLDRNERHEVLELMAREET